MLSNYIVFWLVAMAILSGNHTCVYGLVGISEVYVLFVISLFFMLLSQWFYLSFISKKSIAYHVKVLEKALQKSFFHWLPIEVFLFPFLFVLGLLAMPFCK